MRTFEAGVTDIQNGEPRWTNVFIEASCEEEAVMKFEQAGFYRNLVVRESEKFHHVKQQSLSEQMEAELEPRHWTGSHDIGPVLRHGRES
jgi:hypothetical protein